MGSYIISRLGENSFQAIGKLLNRLVQHSRSQRKRLKPAVAEGRITVAAEELAKRDTQCEAPYTSFEYVLQ